MCNTAVWLVTLQGVGPEEQTNTNKRIVKHFLFIISNYPKAGLFKICSISCAVQNLCIGIALILNKEVALETW